VGFAWHNMQKSHCFENHLLKYLSHVGVAAISLIADVKNIYFPLRSTFRQNICNENV